ncbi:Citrate synthase 3, peroxisomal [Tetrabaena socialis]|uniref:Citrate synthase 3, peroxisomal n=1 Tax=Tetrabaena socialis TaxID=47790 RepID=A0A2J7ZQ26_9CHLO|nr:Citrate synthase 3, peroxisomal [Tetrabaena socialis]|eukprot:PNH02369.1 Citrate synthase 3, peroxisomal [Tetrabaena socialis]
MAATCICVWGAERGSSSLPSPLLTPGGCHPRLHRGREEQEGEAVCFGHRVYRNFDPRATIIKDVAEKEVFPLVGIDPLIEVAKALQASRGGGGGGCRTAQ